MKKTDELDYGLIAMLLGTVITNVNTFKDGMLNEIFVLLGYIVTLAGIIQIIIEYKKHNKKGMLKFAIICGLFGVVTFLLTLYRFIFA